MPGKYYILSMISIGETTNKQNKMMSAFMLVRNVANTWIILLENRTSVVNSWDISDQSKSCFRQYFPGKLPDNVTIGQRPKAREQGNTKAC